MRIGIVTTWFDRGAAMVSRAYQDVLVRAGNCVFIYARGGERQPIGDPAWDREYVTWDTKAWGHATNLNYGRFRRWTKSNALDLVIFNEQSYWPPVVFARRDLRIPIGAYVDYYTEPSVRFFELYDFVLCNTSRHYSVFRWHPAAIHIPWGTDCGVFQPAAEPTDRTDVVFLHSAGMNPLRKGTEALLDAFAAVHGDCRLVLHLQVPLERYPRLAELCRRDPRVSVISQTVGPPGLYHLGDVYVYPSILDGIGLTLAEALACGLPVITTDNPPMNEFVKPGVNGRLVPIVDYRSRADGYYWPQAYCDVHELARAMQEYVCDRATLRERKIAARLFAERRLDWFKNAAGLPAVLQDICRCAPRRDPLRTLEQDALDFSRLYLPWEVIRLAGRRLRLGRRPWFERCVFIDLDDRVGPWFHRSRRTRRA